MSKILVDTIDTRSGTSNITIGSTNASQITLKSGATLTNFPANTPSFVAHADVNQSLSNATMTKLTVTSEDFDTDSAFADSKFTVPSGKAGKYFFVGKARLSNVTGYVTLDLYKNGSLAGIQFRSQSYGTSYESAIITAILDLSVSDYIELYGMQVTGGTANLTGKLLQGYKLT